jgi:hypothetical protein
VTWHDDMALSVYTQYGGSAVLEKLCWSSCFAIVLDNIIWRFAASVVCMLYQCEFTTNGSL